MGRAGEGGGGGTGRAGMGGVRGVGLVETRWGWGGTERSTVADGAQGAGLSGGSSMGRFSWVLATPGAIFWPLLGAQRGLVGCAGVGGRSCGVVLASYPVFIRAALRCACSTGVAQMNLRQGHLAPSDPAT